MKNKWVWVIIVLIVCIGSLLSWQYTQSKQKMAKVLHVVELNKSSTVSIEPKGYQTTAVIGGIGDVLLHDWVYDDAKTKDGYQFDKMFSEVKDSLIKPDFLIANQESIPGGEGLGVSNYPIFNSPFEIVDTLKRNGVDLISSANNHSMDKGEKGILSAIGYFNKVDIPYVGINKDMTDQQRLRISNINNISTAVLSYTFGTNGIPIPKGKEYLVNLINKDKIISDIHLAKEKADIVVISIHWGSEYQRMPNDSQITLAQEMADAGADIIFGHHPHVLQPIETIKRADGSNAVVVYSLGNFLSGQMWEYKDIGGLASVTVQKTVSTTGTTIKVGDVQFQPTYVESHHLRKYKVLPLDKAFKEGLIDHSPEEIQHFMFDEMKGQ
ncbi:CapA family protein [Falsibacillus pallidus]|uniref:Poly-gamma-glutamate synthesis protein (Capsule biosynthesis protein) n=1 Tax=Falsibacillus pallidus TaxID=493781 RepID=A0A370GQ54_9BACI|nr:CapA family protein [Falsibacillus pallidus]RDI45845.1 poly-gamma-glutamate synthesis protein (capsule biosynthesis protein) [Falsibacillus pallidus]